MGARTPTLPDFAAKIRIIAELTKYFSSFLKKICGRPFSFSQPLALARRRWPAAAAGAATGRCGLSQTLPTAP